MRLLWQLRKAIQFGFDFKPREEVKEPGSRGGKGYYDEHGKWQYGERPAVTSKPALTLTAPTPGPKFEPRRGDDRWPAHAKTYDQEGGARDFEVLEGEFVKKALAYRETSLERGITMYQAELAKLSPRAKRKREEYENAIRWWRKDLERLRDYHAHPDHAERDQIERNARTKYRTIVKQAISKGLPVPRPVIAQSIEFSKASSARARYEKGRNTSFGNLTANVDATMTETRGVKVKRQDGKGIPSRQVKEILGGLDEVESVLGSLADTFRKTNVTIVHTSGKHPFMNKYGGLYVPGENTVVVGIQGVPALAHELGHWMDHSAGGMSAEPIRIYPAWGSSRKVRTTSSLAEMDWRKRTGPGYELLAEARRRMSNTSQARQTMRRKLNAETGEERDKLRIYKVQLGDYWQDPVEVWARLVEQYVATERQKAGHDTADNGTSQAHSPLSYYQRTAAWWDPATFAELAPRVKHEIDRRLHVVRTGKDDYATPRGPKGDPDSMRGEAPPAAGDRASTPSSATTLAHTPPALVAAVQGALIHNRDIVVAAGKVFEQTVPEQINEVFDWLQARKEQRGFVSSEYRRSAFIQAAAAALSRELEQNHAAEFTDRESPLLPGDIVRVHMDGLTDLKGNPTDSGPVFARVDKVDGRHVSYSDLNPDGSGGWGPRSSMQSRPPRAARARGGPARSYLFARTVSGRVIELPAHRPTAPGLRKQNEWLRAEAIREAEAQFNEFAADIFRAMDPKRMSTSDKDSAHDFVFGDPYKPTFVEPPAGAVPPRRARGMKLQAPRSRSFVEPAGEHRGRQIRRGKGPLQAGQYAVFGDDNRMLSNWHSTRDAAVDEVEARERTAEAGRRRQAVADKAWERIRAGSTSPADWAATGYQRNLSRGRAEALVRELRPQTKTWKEARAIAQPAQSYVSPMGVRLYDRDQVAKLALGAS